MPWWGYAGWAVLAAAAVLLWFGVPQLIDDLITGLGERDDG